MRGMGTAMLNVYFNSKLRSVVPIPSARSYGIVGQNEEIAFDAETADIVTWISGFVLGMFSSLALLMPILNVLLVICSEASTGKF